MIHHDLTVIKMSILHNQEEREAGQNIPYMHTPTHPMAVY